MALSARDAYRHELTLLAKNNQNILCIEADLGGKNHPFQKNYPDQFFNMGIAEMASIDICTGLAELGFVPFFSTFAPFVALRCAESIKLSMGYMQKNIKIVSCYAGVSGGWFGTTHHCLEDLAIINSIPNIKIACPHGEEETRQVIRDAVSSNLPFYIRLGRNGKFNSITNSTPNKTFVVEQTLDSSAKICLVSIGEQATELAIRAKNELNSINHLHLCYVDKDSLLENLNVMKNSGEHLIFLEEHRKAGSIGSFVSLLLCEKNIHSFTPSDDWIHCGGSHEDLLQYLNFDLPKLLSFINEIDTRDAK
jgi:transketolase